MTAAKLPHLNRAQRRALDRAAKRRAALAKPAPLPDMRNLVPLRYGELPEWLKTPRKARPQTPAWLIVAALIVGAVSMIGLGGYLIADAAGLLPSGGVAYVCPKGAKCDD